MIIFSNKDSPDRKNYFKQTITFQWLNTQKAYILGSLINCQGYNHSEIAWTLEQENSLSNNLTSRF